MLFTTNRLFDVDFESVVDSMLLSSKVFENFTCENGKVGGDFELGG